MNLIDKIQKNKVEFIILVLIFTFFTFMTAGFTFPWKGIPNTDYGLHLEYAKEYAKGNIFAAFEKKFIERVNYGVPYPPLFHLFIAIFVLLNIVNEATIFLQLFSFHIALLSIAFAIYKLTDVKTAILVLLVLTSSGAFFDRVEQVTPQTFDFIFLPLAMYFFKNNKHKSFLIASSIPVYAHSGYGFLILGAFAIYAFLFKKNRKYILHSILICLPIITINLIYLPNAIHYMTTESNPQNQIFKKLFFNGQFEDTFPFTYVGFTIWLLTIPTFFWLERKIKLQQTNYATLFSFIFFLITICLIPFFADRFISYSAFPLAILISCWLREYTTTPKKTYLIYGGLTLLAALSWILGIQHFLIFE